MARRPHATFRWLLTLSLLAISCCLHAQQDSKPYTLHVYMRRVQVPTLVLNSDYKPVPPILRINFRISIDDGPSFLPTNMHMEGNDPLDIAVLLDATGSEDSLLKNFANSFASLAPQDLTSRDHFTVYAMDCTVVATSHFLPANAPALRTAVEDVLHFPTLHSKHRHSSCAGKVPLWDVAAQAVHELSQLPGRRVLLIVSTGADTKSRITWGVFSQYANAHSVAVFGMDDANNPQQVTGSYQPSMRGVFSSISQSYADSHSFQSLCEYNGGMLFETGSRHLTRDLQSFVRMLRGRYILSFPEPSKFEPGVHGIDITVAHKPNFYLTTTGVIVNDPDKNLLNDPTTIPTAPSPVTYGTHRLSYPH